MTKKKSASPPPNAPPPRRQSSERKKEQTIVSSLTSSPFTLIGVLLLPILMAWAGWHAHQHFFVLPALINTKTQLPRVVPDENYTAAVNPELYWGTYRSNLYFGMKTRSPISPVFGLMWYEQPRSTEILVPRIRHWCNQQDANEGLSRYGWMAHDGRTFGVQELEDERMTIVTSFVKQPGGQHGGDWTARISAIPKEPQPADGVDGKNDVHLHSFVLYFALAASGNEGGWIRPNIVTLDKYQHHIDVIEGFTPELGGFRLKFTEPANVVARSFLAAQMEPFPDRRGLKELIISSTGVIKTPKSKLIPHYLGLMGYMPAGAPHTGKPNILALQVTFVKGTEIEVVFESDSNKGRAETLKGAVYEKALKKHVEDFDKKFEQLFPLANYPEVFVSMAKLALSNMLGSIGFFHGHSRVQSIYNAQPVPYGPLSLFSSVPSRPFFPRGFLWDEGFHHLLIRRFDARLSLEMLGSWLDLINVQGWIPREVILGAEAEHKVPAEFIVQRNSVANPPMFFYVLSRYLNEKDFVDTHKEYLQKVYPRLKLWYQWLNSSQSGHKPFTYRWRGRNATTDLELNPKTLPSGLDDYPRASHPTDTEYHLDLYCWMTVSSRVMATLSRIVGDTAEEIKRIEETANGLGDVKRLDELHWSEKTGRYADYGLHTRHVRLEKPKVQFGPDGRPRANQRMDMVRIVERDPQYRLVADTFGYISLFPLFLRLIPADSPKLGRILEQLVDPDLLWTDFGLRSLSKTSPLYDQRNTEHDPPYWRGSIWLNMNYFALSALKHYSATAGPHRDQAFAAYSRLRASVVQNVAREYRRTGFLWEHYNDVSGKGEGSHPFTGWTSLVLLIMSEQLD